MALDSIDRKYLSRYSRPTFGITVYRDGVAGDADALPEVSLLTYDNPQQEGTPEVLWTREATRTALGQYEITLGSKDTRTPGEASLGWTYLVDGEEEIYTFDLQVGESAPDYDALPLEWRAIVESVWIKFADLFDSAFGGPNLQTYVQTKFGRNRMAQLLPSALQRLNSASNPHASYGIGPDANSFPFADWGGLLAQSLYIEILKHLIRSYTEIPEAVLATSVSRFDRRDYMQRWEQVLNMEMAEFNTDLSRYRKANMGLGSVSVLVSGGAYGNWGPQVNSAGGGMAAARGYFAVARWH